MNVTYEGLPMLTAQEVIEAMNVANNAIKVLSDTTMKFDINIFETLGMRNLSGMVGEYFARSVVKVSRVFGHTLYYEGQQTVSY